MAALVKVRKGKFIATYRDFKDKGLFLKGKRDIVTMPYNMERNTVIIVKKNIANAYDCWTMCD